ncbi:UNVERIFIED_CONTAM: hypothetical protein Sradi_6859200 [Sesamum radiatum]|uniref:Uncharacterized protein n=1 Tax=Sesamum radiatum TaxID=300843 RepID=A0AAW2JK73_SESRA
MVMIEKLMWPAVVGGKNKGRVFSLGSEAHFSDRIYRSPSPPPPPSTNPIVEDHRPP